MLLSRQNCFIAFPLNLLKLYLRFFPFCFCKLNRIKFRVKSAALKDTVFFQRHFESVLLIQFSISWAIFKHFLYNLHHSHTMSRVAVAILRYVGKTSMHMGPAVFFVLGARNEYLSWPRPSVAMGQQACYIIKCYRPQLTCYSNAGS